jgi:micrococcal nuclease
MRRQLVVAIVPVLLFVASPPTYSAEDPFTGLVVRVVDGDMIHVQRDGESVKVRLEGIDAPETGQEYGPRARAALMKKILAKTVTVKPTGADKYGRTLADVWIDNRNINLELVREGCAWHFKKYSKDPALAAAEEVAREQRRGLWADANPQAPWDWRKAEKERRKQTGIARATADPSVPAPPPKSSADQEQNPKAASEAESHSHPDESTAIVYIGKTGKRYHSSDCPLVAGKSRAMPLADAKRKGYKPCSKCGGKPTLPDAVIADTDSDLAHDTGATIYVGPRGGHYHYSASGSKVYERRK